MRRKREARRGAVGHQPHSPLPPAQEARADEPRHRGRMIAAAVALFFASAAPLPNPYLVEGRRLYSELKYSKALRQLELALAAAGDDVDQQAETLELLGRCQIAERHLVEAEQTFVRLLKLRPAFRVPAGESPKISEVVDAARARVEAEAPNAVPAPAAPEAAEPAAEQPEPSPASTAASAPAPAAVAPPAAETAAPAPPGPPPACARGSAPAPGPGRPPGGRARRARAARTPRGALGGCGCSAGQHGYGHRALGAQPAAGAPGPGRAVGRHCAQPAGERAPA